MFDAGPSADCASTSHIGLPIDFAFTKQMLFAITKVEMLVVKSMHGYS